MEKILYVYASKTGTTEGATTEVSKLAAVPFDIYNCSGKLLSGNNLTQQHTEPDKFDWDSYGMIIIGTAMYMRKPMKEIILFCRNYQEKLKQKKLVLFTCGIETEKANKEYLWRQLPQELLHAVLYYCHLGGEIRGDKMNAFTRFVLREIVKKNGSAIGINYKRLVELSSKIVQLMK
jgi:menaquinone-dependent protoporphyrinogen oxidase